MITHQPYPSDVSDAEWEFVVPYLCLLPEDAGFYLVSWQADALIDQVAEQKLRHLDDRLRAIEEAHGLGEDEIWDPDEAPPEYRR